MFRVIVRSLGFPNLYSCVNSRNSHTQPMVIVRSLGFPNLYSLLDKTMKKSS
uniref:Uncharacterized protein n=1 Tax=Helianthus annuus TaxID=4232 RepID=A0A251UQ55_HELAN